MEPIVVVGVPTALGGAAAGMERTPAELRRLGLPTRVAALLGSAVDLRDAGDVEIVPGWAEDPDPKAKNRARIAEFLPREAELVAHALRDAGDDARLLILGGDCTAHAGAMAGIRQARPGIRLAIAWFDAHGDVNTPQTTPSGAVWGMPFAMLLGRGDDDLVTAAAGPSARLEDACLIGGQVLDEDESRWISASPVAHFGAGMVRTDAGLAALRAWAASVADGVDGLYVALDHDVLDTADGDWAVQYPEVDGLPLADALRAVGVLATAIPVVGFGATGITPLRGDLELTADAAARLAASALRRGGSG